MHDGGGASDGDEPADAASLSGTSRRSDSRDAVPAHAAPEHSRGRAICIAVDDFGLHSGINQAALQLADMGRAHAIGCMVGAATWPAWGPLLRRLEPHHIDVGLHLDLTEAPLLPGSARPLNTLIRDSLLRRLDHKAVRAEIRAQLDAFEQALERGPAYIDGHQHVHQFPIVRSELIAELGERYDRFRPWLRSTRRPHDTGAAQHLAWRDWAKPWIIEHLGASGLASLARRSGYPQNRHLLGVYPFAAGSRRYSERLTEWLRAAREGDLLMCHASLAAHDGDAIMAARTEEFQVLADPGLATQLSSAGIQLQPMSRILDRVVQRGRVPAD
jgi:predicted glycoside hydrolase/deacetylase ChbG (UPF0249 family)